MKRLIRFYILNKWQGRWASSSLVNNKKYKKIRSSIKPWLSSFNANRRLEIILSRLRIGHTFLTHKFLLESGSPPVCGECNSTLSVEHILVQCTKYRNMRIKYGLHRKELPEILNDEADIDSLIKFVKDIGIFNDI